MPVKSSLGPRPVIAAMGRLHGIKGFDLLLHSAARLRATGQDFMIRLAGDGPELSTLKNLVGSLGLSNHVEFCGWVCDPIQFISSADLFVLPSRYESFGIVLIEAMAAGVPILASDTNGPHEILRGGEFGALFKNEDVCALTVALRSIFTHWDKWRDKARAAQTYAIEEFGFVAGRKRLCNAIESLV